MHSVGVDLEGVVNDSFVFLSDFPDGTIKKRPQGQPEAWGTKGSNQNGTRGRINPREPRYKSIRELQELERRGLLNTDQNYARSLRRREQEEYERNAALQREELRRQREQQEYERREAFEREEQRRLREQQEYQRNEALKREEQQRRKQLEYERNAALEREEQQRRQREQREYELEEQERRQREEYERQETMQRDERRLREKQEFERNATLQRAELQRRLQELEEMERKGNLRREEYQRVAQRELEEREVNSRWSRQGGYDDWESREVIYAQPIRSQGYEQNRRTQNGDDLPFEMVQKENRDRKNDVVYSQPMLETRREQIHWYRKSRGNDDWDEQRHQVEDLKATEGSSLLRRTNVYLDAAERMKKNDIDDSKGKPKGIPVPPPQVPQLKKLEVESHSTNSTNFDNRMSIIDRVKELKKSAVTANPPPPPPPMPIGAFPLKKLERTDSTKAASGPPKKVISNNPQLPYLSDVKNARTGLKPIPQRPEKPQKRDFITDLINITARQAAEIKSNQNSHSRIPPVLEANRSNVPEKVASDKEYVEPKTMGKGTMHKKLNVILVNPPQKPPKSNRPSFQGAVDMTLEEKRKANIAKIRAAEAAIARGQQLEEQEKMSMDEVVDVEVPTRWFRNPDQDPSARDQRMRTGNVFQTITTREHN